MQKSGVKVKVGGIDPGPAGLHVIQYAGWNNWAVNLNIAGKLISFYSL